jgi:hypothetical protein
MSDKGAENGGTSWELIELRKSRVVTRKNAQWLIGHDGRRT